MIKRPIPHYAHILDTLGVIAKYTPKTRQAFMNDPNAQDATLMRLQDIGEQLVHIRDQSLKAGRPTQPMIGIR